MSLALGLVPMAGFEINKEPAEAVTIIRQVPDYKAGSDRISDWVTVRTVIMPFKNPKTRQRFDWDWYFQIPIGGGHHLVNWPLTETADLVTVDNGRRVVKRFVAAKGGTVLDLTEGMEWLLGPAEEVTYEEAVKWFKQLDHAEGNRWMMPFKRGIKTIYRKRAGKHNLDPLYGDSSARVWYLDVYQGSYCFDFKQGKILKIKGTKNPRARVFTFRYLDDWMWAVVA
jgi:hypothetical protein